jgi:hypothetical protein
MEEVEPQPQVEPGESKPVPEVEVIPPDSELNSRQRAFVRHLLSDPSRNATEAAVQAGYGNGNRQSAKRVGSYLLADPRVREEIARREAAADTSMAELVGMRVQCARNAHMGNVIEIDTETGEFRVDLAKAQRTGALEWVKELRFDRWGRPVIKMVDRLAALEQLDAVFGLKQEVRPNETNEEMKRARVRETLDTLRAKSEEMYQEMRRRLLDNPGARRYVVELDMESGR